MNNSGSSTSSLTALGVPGGVVTTQNISTVIRPKGNTNSMQFVKIQTPELSKKAVEQIRVAQESKITKDKIKEVEEEWQNNLLNWKSKRRQQFVGVHDSQNNNEKPQDNGDGITGRKVKTFAEMIEQRARTGNKLNFNLERYIGSGDDDDDPIGSVDGGAEGDRSIEGDHSVDGDRSADGDRTNEGDRSNEGDCTNEGDCSTDADRSADGDCNDKAGDSVDSADSGDSGTNSSSSEERQVIQDSNIASVQPIMRESISKESPKVDNNSSIDLNYKSEDSSEGDAFEDSIRTSSSQSKSSLASSPMLSPREIPPVVRQPIPPKPSQRTIASDTVTKMSVKSPPIQTIHSQPSAPMTTAHHNLANAITQKQQAQTQASNLASRVSQISLNFELSSKGSQEPEYVSPKPKPIQRQPPLIQQHSHLSGYPSPGTNTTRSAVDPCSRIQSQPLPKPPPPLPQQHHHTPRQSSKSTSSREDKDRTVLSVSGKKRCSSCREELGRGAAAFVVESLNLVYHTNCFRCSVCHVNLSNGFRGVDVRVHAGALHCQNCYSKDGLNYSRV